MSESPPVTRLNPHTERQIEQLGGHWSTTEWRKGIKVNYIDFLSGRATRRGENFPHLL